MIDDDLLCGTLLLNLVALLYTMHWIVVSTLRTDWDELFRD